MTSFESIDIIQLKGSECFSFLNNQTISKIETTEDQVCHYSAICNPKGRILFTFFVICHSDQILLAVDAEMTQELLIYLNMRRFRMDVQVEQLDTQSLCLVKGDVSDNHYPLVACEADTTTAKVSLWPTLFSWGLPWITKTYQEKYIPQHVNLDQLGAIDFKKGCYPGQEIIARLHYLGDVKKRMQLIQVGADNFDQPTDEPTGTIKWCSDAHQFNEIWYRQGVMN